MRAAILIPARLDSTRLSRKLMRADTGQPLICHTVETAVAARNLAEAMLPEVIVATDAEEIYAAVNDFCGKRGLAARAEMTRRDHPSGSDRIAEVAARLPAEIDAIVNLQGDEAELDPREIVRLVEMLAASGAGAGPPADIATLAFPITDEDEFRNPNLVKVVTDAAGNALYFSRASIPVERDQSRARDGRLGLGHIGIYAYRRAALRRFAEFPPGCLERLECLEQLRALENGLRIRVGLVQERPPKGVDTEEDYRGFVERMRR